MQYKYTLLHKQSSYRVIKSIKNINVQLGKYYNDSNESKKEKKKIKQNEIYS